MYKLQVVIVVSLTGKAYDQPPPPKPRQSPTTFAIFAAIALAKEISITALSHSPAGPCWAFRFKGSVGLHGLLTRVWGFRV